jgi:hypothetical protein
MFAVVFAMVLALGVQAEEKSLMMATTTSTDNTGLLDYLIPHWGKTVMLMFFWSMHPLQKKNIFKMGMEKTGGKSCTMIL